jgi:hypothetical protein
VVGKRSLYSGRIRWNFSRNERWREMTDIELKTLADLLERLIRKEKVALTDSERMAAIKLVNAADLLAEQRRRRI